VHASLHILHYHGTIKNATQYSIDHNGAIGSEHPQELLVAWKTKEVNKSLSSASQLCLL
jgi:hypothetical protein